MTDFIYFLGRFHVLALHLPIGMLLLTVALDFLSHKVRYNHLSQALPLCWAATALCAVLTVVLGLMHFSEGGFAGSSAIAHRNYGISVAVICLLVWFLVAKLPALYGQLRLITNLLLLFLITMTGHYGGNLTHGSTYLIEYAPQPVRAMAGLEPRRPAVTDIAMADPWYDIVRPVLQARCSSCHNDDKQSGQLNLNSLASLRAGGKSGPSVSSGDAENSELLARISLPENHEDFMPAEGKTPLTESQRDIIRWWINSGLPVNTRVEALSPDQDIIALLASELRLEGYGRQAAPASYPSVSGDILAQLVNMGWQIRPLAQESNGLIVGVQSKGQAVTGAMLQAIASARASVVELNLASTGLTDELLFNLENFPALQKLNLSNNSVSDDGVKVLVSNTALRVLNLYGNPQISDAGLASLSGLTELEVIYIWGTGLGPDGIKNLSSTLPGVTVVGRSEMLMNENVSEQ